MHPKRKHPSKVWLLSGVAVLPMMGVALGAARHDYFVPDPQSPLAGEQAASASAEEAALSATGGHCGAASARAIASVDGEVARRIYAGELRGSEVEADAAHIAGDAELSRALSNSDEAGVYAAVHKLVYTPHWHIVRLRVMKGGRVIADVGGPDVIAPVSGTLRWQGRDVGNYVMSVQDDAGYTKLVSRFVGVPIDLYRNDSFIMGTLQPAPAAPKSGQAVSAGGVSYEALVLQALAFPEGALQAALFLPKPSSLQARRPCGALRTAAWGAIAEHVARRYSPLSAHYGAFAGALKGASAGLVFVRDGSKRLVGAATPRQIPHSGTFDYGGRLWSVFSWEPYPPARVYLLTRLSRGG
jgi:hypothetical protein